MSMKTNVLLLFALVLSGGAFAQSDFTTVNKQFEMGDYKNALKVYLSSDQELGINENLNIARCYLHLGNEIKSAEYYGKARAQSPGDPSFAIEYGKALIKNALYYDAKEEFRFAADAGLPSADHYISYVDFALDMMANGTSYKAVGLYSNSNHAEFAPRYINDELVFSSYNSTIELAQSGLDNKIDRNTNHFLVGEMDPNRTYLQGLNTKTNIEAISKTDFDQCAYAISNPKCQSFECRSRNNSIYFAKLVDHKLIDEQPFPFNDVNVSNTDPYITADGSTLYFASDRPGGYGGFDIYVSNYDGYGWSMPENLGDEVNTPGNERTPFLAEGKFLWFASDYHLGLGGYDIFKTQYTMGGWLNTQNAGIGINSAFDELYPWVKNEEIFYSSDRMMGQGGEDLYQSQLINRDQLISFGDSPIPQAIEIQTDYRPEINLESVTTLEGIALLEVTTNTTRSFPVLNVETFEAHSLPNFDTELEDNITEVIVQSTPLTTTAPPVFEIPVFKSEQMTRSPHPDMVGATQVALGTMVKKEASQVYFIQVAALYQNKNNLAKFKELAKYGNVYSLFKNRAKKIRVGYFLDESQANVVLSTVRAMGFKDAFVVSDPLNTSDLELIYSSVNQNYSSENQSQTTFTTTTEAKGSSFEATTSGVYDNSSTAYTEPQSVDNFAYAAPLSANSVYKVRLASYEDPIWFDGNTVKDIGQIEQWSKGGWTIFILSGYTNYDTAELARIKAVNRGFVDAEVVIDNDGVIERLKKN